VLVPLHGFLAGDTLGVLVLVHGDEAVQVIADRLMAAAAMRVVPFAPCEVVFRGVVLDPARSVSECGLRALDRVDVRRARSAPRRAGGEGGAA
jgi:hypothetical protein